MSDPSRDRSESTACARVFNDCSRPASSEADSHLWTSHATANATTAAARAAIQVSGAVNPFILSPIHKSNLAMGTLGALAAPEVPRCAARAQGACGEPLPIQHKDPPLNELMLSPSPSQRQRYWRGGEGGSPAADSLVAERLDGVEARSLSGGIEPEKDPHGGAESE